MVPSLCVSLEVDKDIVDVKKYDNTKKNINKVYKILKATEKLYVSLNERREATFYNNNKIRIYIKLSKKKKEKIKESLDTIEESEGEEIEWTEGMEKPYQEDFVEEVVYSLLHENLVIEEFGECLRKEEATCSG